MPIGTCKLCLQSGVELRRSHLIPAGAYRLIRNSDGSPPIVMKSSVTVKKDEQITDFVLCATCEQRFSENGERWVLEYCNQFDAGFKLNDLIEASTLLDTPNFRIYSAASIPEIDIEKLAYFASSVLWRGSAHDWRSGKDPVRTPKLGAYYEEEFRKYLTGEAPFPENAVLSIDVMSDSNFWSLVYVPYGGRKEDLAWRYTFPFLGLVFLLFLGKTIHPVVRRHCSYRSPEKIISKGAMQGENLIASFGALLAKSRVVGSLKGQTVL